MNDSPTNTIPRGLQQILSSRSARDGPWPSSLFDGHRGVGFSLPSAAPRTPGRGRQAAVAGLGHLSFYLAPLEVTEQARISPRTTDTFRLKGIDVSGPIDRTRLRRRQRRSTREPPQSRRRSIRSGRRVNNHRQRFRTMRRTRHASAVRTASGSTAELICLCSPSTDTRRPANVESAHGVRA